MCCLSRLPSLIIGIAAKNPRFLLFALHHLFLVIGGIHYLHKTIGTYRKKITDFSITLLLMIAYLQLWLMFLREYRLPGALSLTTFVLNLTDVSVNRHLCNSWLTQQHQSNLVLGGSSERYGYSVAGKIFKFWHFMTLIAQLI